MRAGYPSTAARVACLTVPAGYPRNLGRQENLLSGLVAYNDWWPEAFATADPNRYRQYLLYCDPLERFSLVSFVWGPGQKTPVHDHLM